MSFAIPVKRLRETTNLIAFHHPSPSYPVHILIVPRKNLRSLEDLSLQDPVLLSEIIHLAQELIAEFELEQAGYRLIVNGGKYQEIPFLHFHLVSGGSV